MKSVVADAWENLERALDRHAPHYLHSLRPGASAETFARFRAEFEADAGLKLPLFIEEFFSRHDGEIDQFDIRPLFQFAIFLPLNEPERNSVLSQWRYNRTCEKRATGRQVQSYLGPVKPVVRHPLWIPFATNLDGDGLYFDLDPDQGGAVGQVIDCNYHQSSIQVLAPSIEAFLNHRAFQLEAAAVRRPQSSSHTPVFDAWRELEEALRVKAPQVFKALHGPVDMEDLEFFEKKTTVALPQEVKEFFFAHNGEDSSNENLEPLFDFGYLIPLVANRKSDVLTEWEAGIEVNQAMKDGDFDFRWEGPVRKLYYSRKWIPFATDFSGNHLCFDLAPLKGGKVGQILECDYEMNCVRVVSESIVAFLKARAMEVREGLATWSPSASAVVPPPKLSEGEAAAAPPEPVVSKPAEILEVTVEVKNVKQRPNDSILCTSTLSQMDLAFRLLDPTPLMSAFSHLDAIESKQVVAFTVFRPSNPNRVIYEWIDDFEVQCRVEAGAKAIGAGEGTVSGGGTPIGHQQIRYVYSREAIPEDAVLYLGVKAKKVSRS